MSKIDSLGEIIEQTKPDIISLNEIKTNNSGKIKTFFEEKGYAPFIRASGGIVLAAKKCLEMVNVTTSISQSILAGFIPGLNIRIINAYGPQETVSKDERQDFFDELSTLKSKHVNTVGAILLLLVT